MMTRPPTTRLRTDQRSVCALGIVTSRNGNRLEIAGEIDLLSTGTIVAAALALPHGQDLTIDLARASFIDAAGLDGLVLIHNRLVMAGRRLFIIGATPRIARTFGLGRAAWLLTASTVDQIILDRLAAAVLDAARTAPHPLGTENEKGPAVAIMTTAGPIRNEPIEA